FLATKRTADGVTLYMEKHQRDAGNVIESVQLPAATSKVELRVEANDATCAFSYAAEPGAWKTLLAAADAKMLTTDVAGGFVGAVAGLHARRDADQKRAATTGANADGKQTFVIVHGAWAGGWEHKKIAEALEAKGHKVFRPTLTGQGERVHLAKAVDVDLSMHIHDIVNFIEWEDLNDIVLVGHSYGGMVITGVADRVANRLKHVIYLDAFLPENGESAQTSRGANAPSRPAVNGFFSIG